MASFRFNAIGTDWQIDTPVPLSDDVRAAVLAEAERFDRAWSRFRDESQVAELASAGGDVAFPYEGAALFALYDRLYAMTDGAVDPLVGADLERLGYDRRYSLRPSGCARRPRLGWPALRREGATLRAGAPVVLDVGAAGKGLLVDRLAELLEHHDVNAFTVDGSGDLRHAGAEPLRVGLQHPLAPDRVVGVATIREQALCASATTRRAWGDGLHHVLDARTGAPTSDVIATWAIAADAMTADGLATGLFFAVPEASDWPDTFWVRLTAAGELQASPGFAGELFH